MAHAESGVACGRCRRRGRRASGWSDAFIAGDGKGSSANDCLAGIDGAGGSAVGILRGKLAVQCTDCDPACDADGGTSANGSCPFPIAACVNSPDVAGCAPAALATVAAYGFTLKVDSNVGGSADPREWPGGSDAETPTLGCSVVVDLPSDDLDLVGRLGR